MIDKKIKKKKKKKRDREVTRANGKGVAGGYGLESFLPPIQGQKAREILRMKFPYALTSCMVISPGQNLVNPDNPISQDTQALAPS
ncbi:hypothetical protein HZH68_014298 [Vespula germanica]|uniref:Uncharacterized protein n=1 Tax=Vespula germanica TaxID=30212 RepID=A0A834JBR7_VESGE|nr:hypothetical protein HZH68_014298 [Vespula germanica]